MSNIIPTPEDAAAAHRTLRRLTDPPEGAFLGATLAQHTAASTVLPLLEAIADGRVFEVRSERCTRCGGEGHVSFCDAEITITEACPRCGGSGYEPAPPGRKQRTAYDAMIEAAAEGGALDEF